MFGDDNCITTVVSRDFPYKSIWYHYHHDQLIPTTKRLWVYFHSYALLLNEKIINNLSCFSSVEESLFRLTSCSNLIFISYNVFQTYKKWILKMFGETWNLFHKKFITLWNENKGGPGEAYLPHIYNNPDVWQLIQTNYMRDLFHDSLGFGSAKMIRWVQLTCNFYPSLLYLFAINSIVSVVSWSFCID